MIASALANAPSYNRSTLKFKNNQDGKGDEIQAESRILGDALRLGEGEAKSRRTSTQLEVEFETTKAKSQGFIFGQADKAGDHELNRAIFYHNIDPNHNLDKFFSTTQHRLAKIRSRINVGLTLDPLDAAYVDACCEREKTVNRFEARNKYFWMWQREEETNNFWTKITTNKINKAKKKLEKAGLMSWVANMKAAGNTEDVKEKLYSCRGRPLEAYHGLDHAKGEAQEDEDHDGVAGNGVLPDDIFQKMALLGFD
ncbi:MAG: hypothetical protein M1836_002793 [Candelina mexicana]|nr:MAG: hypothetical protein M1836_002793 [Candelina mexicana]